MAASTEYELWQQFQTGDEQAFSTIYDTFFPVLYRYGYHITPDEELVKDCIQTLFVELWRSRRNLSTPASIKFYLLKAMRRQVYRALRFQSSFLSVDTLTDTEGDSLVFAPEFDLITAETDQWRRTQLRLAIDQLTNRQKEAITLLYLEELSYAEISAIMALKTRSVYNLIHEALEKLRITLGPSGSWLVVLGLVVHQF